MLKIYAKCFGTIVRTYISLLEMAADIFLPPILLAFLFLKKLNIYVIFLLSTSK